MLFERLLVPILKPRFKESNTSPFDVTRGLSHLFIMYKMEELQVHRFYVEVIIESSGF